MFVIACYSSHQKGTHTHHPSSSPVNYTDSFAPSPIKCLPSCLVSQGLFHLNLLHYKNLSTIYFFQSNWCHYGASKTHRTQYMKTHTHTHTHTNPEQSSLYTSKVTSSAGLTVVLFHPVISPVTDHF